jgi:hypothetical protein
VGTRLVAELDLDAVTALSVADRAYIAGFFDGEGSVGLYPKKSGFALKVSFTQRKPTVLLWLHSVFGGAFVTIPSAGQSKQYYELRYESRESALIVLKVIAPYVREKREQVELVLSHYADHSNKTEDDKNNVVSRLKDRKHG